MVSLIELVTWPIVILGCFKGALRTYQKLRESSQKEQEQVLQYWVVLVCIMFVFPWLEYFASWIMLGSVFTLIKTMTLFAAVVSEKGYGTMYMFVEEHLVPAIEPYVKQFLHVTKDLRTTICDNVLLGLHQLLRSVLFLTKSEVSDAALEKFGTKWIKIMTLVQKEQGNRTKKEKQSTKTKTVIDDVDSPEPTLSETIPEAIRERQNVHKRSKKQE